MYNNTTSPGERLIARGHGRIVDEVEDEALWTTVERAMIRPIQAIDVSEILADADA